MLAFLIRYEPPTSVVVGSKTSPAINPWKQKPDLFFSSKSQFLEVVSRLSLDYFNLSKEKVIVKDGNPWVGIHSNPCEYAFVEEKLSDSYRRELKAICNHIQNPHFFEY